jgi:VWFA-related protein
MSHSRLIGAPALANSDHSFTEKLRRLLACHSETSEKVNGMSKFYRMCFAFLLCVPAFACAQQSSSEAGVVAQAAPAPMNPGDRRIKLDVLVTDGKGTPVPGLTQQDFTLLDNGQARPIHSFQAFPGTGGQADPPVQVVLVLDTVNMEYTPAVQARVGIDRFLRLNGGHLSLPTSVFVLADDGVSGQLQPTTDGNALAENFKQLGSHMRSVRQSAGSWGANERFQLSLKAFTAIAQNEAKLPGRKMLIWCGPGWPLFSGPNMMISSKDQHSMFGSIVAFSTLLREARITVYSVALGQPGMSTVVYQEFLKGVKSDKQAAPGYLALRVQAVKSGGRVLGPDNDLTPQIASCFQDAAAYYTLSFEPPRADARDEYHDLKVQVSKPELKVYATTGYYDEP